MVHSTLVIRVLLSGNRALCNLEGIGHGGTYMQPYGGDYSKVATAWLNWWLKDDKESSAMFTGAEPGIGKMAGWSFDRKNIQ